MDSQTWVGLAGLLMTGVGALWAMFTYFQSRISALEEKVEEDVRRVAEEDQKARHRRANELQATIAKLDAELRVIRDGAATKPELSQVETRLTLFIGKVEARIERIESKLEPLPAMQALLQQVVQTVEKISAALLKERV